MIYIKDRNKMMQEYKNRRKTGVEIYKLSKPGSTFYSYGEKIRKVYNDVQSSLKRNIMQEVFKLYDNSSPKEGSLGFLLAIPELLTDENLVDFIINNAKIPTGEPEAYIADKLLMLSYTKRVRLINYINKYQYKDERKNLDKDLLAPNRDEVIYIQKREALQKLLSYYGKPMGEGDMSCNYKIYYHRLKKELSSIIKKYYKTLEYSTRPNKIYFVLGEGHFSDREILDTFNVENIEKGTLEYRILTRLLLFPIEERAYFKN